jgi:porin
MKNNIHLTLLYIACLVGTTKNINSQELSNKEPLTYEASYIGDNMNNLKGGIKTGSCYLGLANIQLTLNTENAGLWKNGELHINAANTHGSTPSGDLFGDLQVASNIEAGNHTFFQELWYKQFVGSFELKTGLLDLNVDYANTNGGGLFTNSSFGIMPTISGNIPTPLYPLTALGFSAKWNMNEKINWLNGLYACPTDFDNNNPYNLNWKLRTGQGTIVISEIQISTTIFNLAGSYKLGTLSHNHLIDKSKADSLNINRVSIYALADQLLWKNAHHSISLFMQMGISPSAMNTNDYYLGGGIGLSGVFRKNNADEAGLAIAYTHTNTAIAYETVLELTYRTEILKNIFVQPDIQYIINPAGLGVKLENSLAATFRFGFSF